MRIIALIGFVIVGLLLVAVAALAPRRSGVSRFELERRRDEGDTSAAVELEREVHLQDVLSLRRVSEAVLLVLAVLLAVAAFDVWVGVIIAIALALGYGRLSQIGIVQRIANRQYDAREPALMRFVAHHPRVFTVLRSVPLATAQVSVSSRHELEHLVSQLGTTVITPDEKKLITNGLAFGAMTVESVMTPRGVVATIRREDLVGPLLLDELHRTGYSRFPVIDGDIDHVIGVLHVRDLLMLGSKTSQKADELMEQKVYYINQDQSLEHALAAFLRTRHHLFIVVNGYRETAGILTLEDVIEALLGRKIIDEFDIHDDLRLVAERSAKLNNNPPHGMNV